MECRSPKSFGSESPRAFNQDIKAFASEDDVDPLYLFHAIDAQRDQIRDRAEYASHGHGTKKLMTPVLSGIPIVVPTRTIQQAFCEVVSELHGQSDVLDNQNVRLQQARDLLLPRLMNGELAA